VAKVLSITRLDQAFLVGGTVEAALAESPG
jgi:hypothetical protein